MSKNKNTPSFESVFAEYRVNLRELCNHARFNEALALVKKYRKKYPQSVILAYDEAVFEAEEEEGFTKEQIKARHKKAAKKLKVLLKSLRSIPESYRASIRNEYYWFSHQPYKQYLLGREQVLKGFKNSYYSQGVGATELAKKYGLQGRKKLCIRWAERAEYAWIRYFRVVPNWSNSYFFYAAALGYQGRIKEMNVALYKAAKIAKKPKNWKYLETHRIEIKTVLSACEN